ncbi:MAG: glycoside hydrolase family 99-like domain-containing protein [Chthoniobacterales bacterium]
MKFLPFLSFLLVAVVPLTASAADLSKLDTSIDSWNVAPRHEEAISVRAGDDLHPSVLRVDARGGGLQNVGSKPFPVRALQGYKFSVQVWRLEGDMNFSAHLVWLDSEGKEVGTEFAMMGVMIPGQWTPLRYEVIAPEKAVSARIVIYLPAGWGADFADFKLEPASFREDSLSVDLLCSPIGADGAGGATLDLRVENRGSSVYDDVRVEVDLPAGLSSTESSAINAGRLSYGEVFELTIPIAGYPDDVAKAITATARATVAGKPEEFTVATLPFITTATEKEVPTQELAAPVAPRMDIKLGAYYFPVMLDWDRADWGIRDVDYMNPLLGYYDEARPEVADWHTWWAVEHGISFFIFCWYQNQGMEYLNDALDEGFLKSRFANQMEFAVNWCTENHAAEFKPESFSDAALADAMTILCDKYFGEPNYLKVDGRPVVFLQTPIKLIAEVGGLEKMNQALERMRELARERGHDGVYFVAVHIMPYLIDFKSAGFDCVTAYAYGFRDVPKTKVETGFELPYPALVPRHREAFAIAQAEAHEQGLDYIPVAWVGWDDNGRSPEGWVRTTDNTPSAFRRMLEMLPDYVEDEPRLALFEAWNEWGEGGHAEPSKEEGFGKLSAIRDVLSNHRGPYEVPVPPASDVADFETDVTWADVHSEYSARYARKVGLPENGFDIDFEAGEAGLYLRPLQGLRDVELEDGRELAESVSEDPAFLSPPMLQLPATDFSALEITMKVENGTRGSVCWTAEKIGKWVPERCITFPVAAGEDFQTYRIDLAEHPEWKGTINQFRIDPTNAAGRIEIERVRTIKADANQP